MSRLPVLHFEFITDVDCTPTMPALTFPAFPEDIPTHPLLVIDYSLIVSRDPQEIDRLWEAATKLGFW